MPLNMSNVKENSIRGHGIIMNMSSYLPFVFQWNPESVTTTKKINYVIAPNIGGSHKKRFFCGFDSGEIEFKIVCFDKTNPLGVSDQIGYFEQLRQPDPGLIGIAASFFGNENYPPPRVLFQFGASFIPLVWDIINIGIEKSHFFDDPIRGIIGIPKRAEISVNMALVEDHMINKANKIAEKASYVAGSAESLVREGFHFAGNGRKEILRAPKMRQ